MPEQNSGWTRRRVLVIVGIVAAILIYALTIQVTEISLDKALEPSRQEGLVRVLRLLADPDILGDDRAGLSETTWITIERIIETILMALMASTVGTLLAVPVSFLAARNLMEDITSPLAAVMGGLVALPIGAFAGLWLTSLLVGWVQDIARLPNGNFISLATLAAPAAGIWAINRFAPPLVSLEQQSRTERTQAVLGVIASLLLAMFGLITLAQLGLVAGDWLSDALSVTTILGIDFFGFYGNLVYVVSDVIVLLLPALVGLVIGLAAASYGSRYGQQAVIAWPAAPARLLTAGLTALGTTVIVLAIAGFVYWLKEFDTPEEWVLWAAIAGGLVASMLALAAWPYKRHENPFVRFGVTILVVGGGGVVAGLVVAGLGRLLSPLFDQNDFRLFVGSLAFASSLPAVALAATIRPSYPFALGFGIYTASRSVLNVLRSIEPLVLGIVFVVWVSLGPFAGIMALTLHSIAALGKLFSEQVEGILEGPLEAITATGAGRLQTIVYAVIPQIIPPYIAFALYRWDINVRMSTIIGFVGGGGIGFVLSQNIQQLRYRQASVMMLAIALVVALLDYASSRIRSRII